MVRLHYAVGLARGCRGGRLGEQPDDARRRAVPELAARPSATHKSGSRLVQQASGWPHKQESGDHSEPHTDPTLLFGGDTRLCR